MFRWGLIPSSEDYKRVKAPFDVKQNFQPGIPNRVRPRQFGSKFDLIVDAVWDFPGYEFRSVEKT